MRKQLSILCALGLLMQWSFAQTNGPVRLALIAPEAALRPALDLLTVELSQQEGLVLLERAEIERVWREQSLAATGPDYVKLGQVLGADGLFMVEIVNEGPTNVVALRLVAVKPGVALGAVRSPWPVTDVAQWVKGIPNHFAPLFPKLTVLAKDAVPISVVNLRAAVSSRETRELEQQLTLLAIDRLTHERELFVLERRRMELLRAEKELKGVEDSVFWNGAYLLEGVIDRDGYSKERVTLHARLVTPNGGRSLELVVATSRTNLAEVVEQLTTQVLQRLKRGSSPIIWQPKAEAEKYYEEAQWALKWKMISEAQSASESAWALGKRDMDCALVRVKSYLPGIAPVTSNIKVATAMEPANRNTILKEVAALNPLALHYDECEIGNTIETKYLYVTELPDPQSLDRALHALGLFADFTQSLPTEEPKAGSAWYYCGLEVLDRASLVLNCFQLVADHVPELHEKLAELRALARAVAERLTQPASVRDGYWVGSRIASHDELVHTMSNPPHIFRIKLKWGCFWQERPEDALDVYRELLSSPVFCYFHTDFWLRELSRPRLVGWTKADRERIPAIWSGFLNELNNSTNFLWRMEAKALEFADVKSDADVAKPFEELFAILFANYEAMVTNNVELPYGEWGLSALIYRNGMIWPNRSKLQSSPHFQRLRGMRDEWWRRMNKRKAVLAQAEAFENQKKFLQTDDTYDRIKIDERFRLTSYSPAQAAELAPLLARYKSSLLTRIEEKAGLEKSRLRGVLGRVALVENAVNHLLHPSTQTSAPVASGPSRPANSTAAPPGRPVAMATAGQPSRTTAATNALMIDRFVALPMERFKQGYDDETLSDWRLVGQSFDGDRLWLDVRYKQRYAKRFPGGAEYFNHDRAAAVFWDPQRDEWDLISYPDPAVPPNRLPLEYAGITPKALYVSGWDYLRRYEFAARQWESFPAPWQKPARLFRVGERCFAAGEEAIFEIRDGGRSIDILASCRRRPAASALDLLESLGQPLIFPGPGTLIRAAVAGKIFSWDGRDWNEASIHPVSRVEVFDTAALVFSSGFRRPFGLWLLPHSQTNGLLCLQEEWREAGPIPTRFQAAARTISPESEPRWKTLPGLANGVATPFVTQSNVYFYVEQHVETNRNGRTTVMEKEGRHADLVHLDPESASPLVIPLKFDLNRGALPATSLERAGGNIFNMERRGWMLSLPKAMVIGRTSVPGFWVLPVESINRAFSARKEQLIQTQRERAEGNQKRSEQVLKKYDRNRNDHVDGDERVAAIEDPEFLELELSKFDANQNHQLDAEELVLFDANGNQRLEPGEEAGLNVFIGILAARAHQELDQDGDGRLAVAEFSKAYVSFDPLSGPGRNDAYFRSDKNNDRNLDPSELESYLKERLQISLRFRPVMGRSAGFRPPSAVPPVGFKAAVEAYWSNQHFTNQPPNSPVAAPVASPTGPP